MRKDGRAISVEPPWEPPAIPGREMCAMPLEFLLNSDLERQSKWLDGLTEGRQKDIIRLSTAVLTRQTLQWRTTNPDTFPLVFRYLLRSTSNQSISKFISCDIGASYVGIHEQSSDSVDLPNKASHPFQQGS